MEEIEASTESLEEEIHHQAHSSAQSSKDRWISQVALSSALFAVLAAISALLSNHHSNEAMREEIQASDQWGYYQAKGMKASILSTKLELLTALGKKTTHKDEEKLAQYRKEQDEISREAVEKEEKSESHLQHHIVLARGVTLFQVAIAIAAISVLTKRRRFWLSSIGLP